LDAVTTKGVYEASSKAGLITLPGEAIFSILEGYEGSSRPTLLLGMDSITYSPGRSARIFRIVPKGRVNKLFAERASPKKVWNGSDVFIFGQP
jgi:hypothetical protein